MENKLLERLKNVRNSILSLDQITNERKYHLVDFDKTYMDKNALPGTPFRCFESVPVGRPSKRKQNDDMSFDPYVDTLFDYPLIVRRIMGDEFYNIFNEVTLKNGSNLKMSEDIKYLNYHLTVQLPFCGMDCWHCYNEKITCSAGYHNQEVEKIKGAEDNKYWNAENILKIFAACRKQGKLEGKEYNVLRVSGGEPFLVPELIAELLEKISTTKNEYYPKFIWTETNLVSWSENEEKISIVDIACQEAKETGLDIKGIFLKNRI